MVQLREKISFKSILESSVSTLVWNQVYNMTYSPVQRDMYALLHRFNLSSLTWKFLLNENE